MGEMEGWMDETFIKGVFQTVIGETVQVKVIRDRNSGYVVIDLRHLVTLDADTRPTATPATASSSLTTRTQLPRLSLSLALLSPTRRACSNSTGLAVADWLIVGMFDVFGSNYRPWEVS